MNKDMMLLPIGTKRVIIDQSSGADFLLGTEVQRVSGKLDDSDSVLFTDESGRTRYCGRHNFVRD